MKPVEHLRRFFSRSLENPSTPLSNPADWLFDSLGAKGSHAGASVSPTNALEVSSVWAAVRLIAGTMGTLPKPVYQHVDGGKQKARSHPLYRLLHDSPNPETPSFVFFEALQAHLLLYGNAYAEIERNGAGIPVALWPLHPANVRVERRNGRKVYLVLVQGQEVPLAAENVLHVPGFSLDGSVGLFPIQLARNAVGLAKATEEYGSRFFSNDARPGGALTHPGKLGAEAADRLKKSWNAAHQGLSAAQRVAVLEEGMTFQPFGIPPEHAQFLETRKFSVTEIARVFGIPPHLIGDLERATFSNIESQQIQFVQFCIEPWARRWEQVLNHDLFETSGDYFAEFNLEGLLRGDSASRASFYNALFGIGVLSPNDIRERENMNRVEGGDARYVPLNMQQLGAAPSAPLADAARALVDAEVGRYVRRHAKQAARGNVDEAWYASQETILTENLEPTLRAYFQLTNRAEDPTEFIRRAVRNPETIEL